MTSHPDQPSSPVARMIILLIALITFLITLRTISNSDFWLHLSAGREVSAHGIQRTDALAFTTAGTAWVQTSWLYDWFLYRLWMAGGPGLIVALHATAAGLAMGLAARLAAGRRSSTVLGALLALWLATPMLAVRPTLPALMLAGVTLTVLSRPRSFKRMLAILLPLQVLWVNIHATFLLAPLFAVLTGLAESISARRRSRRPDALPPAQYVMLAAALLVVSLVNPYGMQAHLRAAYEFFNPTSGWMLEWISPFAGLFEQGGTRALTTVTLALTALGFVLHLGRLPPFATTLGIVSAFLLVRSPQHAEWCALLAMPFLVLSCDALTDFLHARLPPKAHPALRTLIPTAAALALLITVVQTLDSGYLRGIGSASRFGIGVERDLFPLDAATRVLELKGFPQSVYNLPPDGGALRWEHPTGRIFCDARTSLYGPGFFHDFNLALRGDSNRWDRLTARWPPEAFVFNCCWSGSGSMIRNLLIGGQWSLVYFDGSSVVLMPALRRNLPWLRRRDLQQAGLASLEKAQQQYASDVAAGRHPRNPARLIGAASFLQSLGRFRDAAAIYAQLVQGSPEMTGAWLNLGICLVQSGQSQAAVPVLEYAMSRLSKNVMAHLWLSRACRENGDTDRADRLQEEAARIDQAVADAFAGIANQTNALPESARLLR